MAHSNTILAQILKFVPRHKFETLAKQHHSGRSFSFGLPMVSVRDHDHGAIVGAQ